MFVCDIFNHRECGSLGNVVVVHVVFIENVVTLKCLTDGVDHVRTKLMLAHFLTCATANIFLCR